MTNSYIPILLMLVVAGVLGAVFLGLNWILGRHQRNPSKLAPYESGVPLLDENRKRVNVRFYQIAMLFILFDIEAAFLYPWAVIYRDATRTSSGAGVVRLRRDAVFILLLGVGYVYVLEEESLRLEVVLNGRPPTRQPLRKRALPRSARRPSSSPKT